MNVKNIDSKVALPVMERFYTIQGEGRYSGRAAYFIRLAGCDVGCVWCDVKESWDAKIHPLLTIEEIIEEIKRIANSPTRRERDEEVDEIARRIIID